MSHYSHTDLKDTIVALSTPPGVGAIGVVRMSGSRAIEICDVYFKGKKLSKQPSHTAHFGSIVKNDQTLDEVLVTIFKNPRSYTGEDSVEVSCHGSPYILQKVIELFVEGGARLAKPGEFTMRAFLNGRMDLSQAEAVADLITSETASAHRVAMQQMRGGYSKQIEALRQQLVDFASLIELELDFGEEDVEFAKRDELLRLVGQISALVTRLLESFALGNAIKNGVSTVIAGRPNAGKSTLLNALLNENRAIVSDIAGTTRDTIEEILNINGIAFRLVDTAGIRQAEDTIEALGVEKTLQTIGQSTILVYVFDLLALTPQQVETDLEQLRHDGLKIIRVGNKSDALNCSLNELEQIFAPENEADVLVCVSAKNAAGLQQLKEGLYQTIAQSNQPEGSSVVSNLRHYEALGKAQVALEMVNDGIATQLSGELLALDIRAALDAPWGNRRCGNIGRFAGQYLWAFLHREINRQPKFTNHIQCPTPCPKRKRLRLKVLLVGSGCLQ